ncbi:MAG: hypothetical protein ABSE96_24130 [Terracidiphilus sp.]
MKAYRRCILVAALIPVTAWFCPLAFAQEETGALNGQITDHDGLLMAGVKVQALSAGTNLSYLADTNKTGFWPATVGIMLSIRLCAGRELTNVIGRNC